MSVTNTASLHAHLFWYVREQHELTRLQLARILGVSGSMIAKIETGVRNPSIKVYAKLNAYLNGRTQELLAFVMQQASG